MRNVRPVTLQEIDSVMDFPSLVEHLRRCHLETPAASDDVMLVEPGEPGTGNSFLTRAAWRRGKILGIKSGSVFPGNLERGLPTIQAVVVLFDGETGSLLSVMDGDAITYWKTAADSALGSKLMSRETSRSLLMVGAGALAEHLIRAHRAVRPDLEDVSVWNRTAARADALVGRLCGEMAGIRRIDDLEQAVRQADVICCATASEVPLVKGAWLKAGAHLDLVGSFTPQMREADNACFSRAEVAVDWRQGTVGQCGEIIDAMAASALSERNFKGDLYDICGCLNLRGDQDGITLFKNGGGGHLDLMTAEFAALRLDLWN